MSKYVENSKGFKVPENLKNDDKLIMYGDETFTIHQLMQSTIDALSKVEPVFIGPEKFGVANETDNSKLAVTSNLLSLDATGTNTKHLKYIVTVPLKKPAKVKSFTVYYSVGTADLGAASFTANLKSLKAHGTAPAGNSITLTGTPLTTKTHNAITMTVDDPAKLGDAEYMDILLDFTSGDKSVLKFYGVVVDYE